MEKVVAELDLAKVVHIATRLPGDDDDKTKFYFEVHFSQGKGSPWMLRTYTQVAPLSNYMNKVAHVPRS